MREILHGIKIDAVAWIKILVKTFNAFWKCFVQVKKFSFRFENAKLHARKIVVENVDIMNNIVSLGRTLHLEANEEDVDKLVEKHAKDLTTENLDKLKKQVDLETYIEDEK